MRTYKKHKSRRFTLTRYVIKKMIYSEVCHKYRNFSKKELSSEAPNMS